MNGGMRKPATVQGPRGCFGARPVWPRGVAALLLVVGLAVAGTAAAFMREPPPAVTVNGVGIPTQRIAAEERWILSQKTLFHPQNEGQAAAVRREALDRVIVWELVRQKLAAAGRLTTAGEVAEHLSRERARVGEIFDRYLAILGQDEITFKLRSENVLNFKRYQAEYIDTGVKVTEAETRERYANSELAAQGTSYEAARSGIEEALRAGKSAAAVREHTAALKREADIKVLAPEYREVTTEAKWKEP